MIRVFFALLVILAFHSCTYELEDTSEEWQPYREKDELIFQSDAGLKQTITIEAIHTQTSDVDALSLIPKKQEIIKVFGKSSTITDSVILNSERFQLLKLSAFSKNRENLWFGWRTPNSKLYGSNVIELKQLELMKTEKLEIQLGKVDAYVFECSQPFVENRANFIKRFYWNKNLGYVRFELGSGEKWTLISKLRN